MIPNLFLGVYEMRQHTVLPSKLAQFSHRFQQGVEDRNKYSQLIGIWYSDFGELNQGTELNLLSEISVETVTLCWHWQCRKLV